MNKEELENIKKELKSRKADEVWKELKDMKQKIEQGEATEEERKKFEKEVEGFIDLMYEAIYDFDYSEVVRFEMTNDYGVKAYVCLTPDWKIELGDAISNNTYLQDYNCVIDCVEGDRNNIDDSWKIGWITDEKEDENGNYLLFDDDNKEWISEDEAIERYIDMLEFEDFSEEKDRWFQEIIDEFRIDEVNENED